MVRAPSAAEAEIEIAERAGERDLADIRRAVERGRCRFQMAQSAHDLVGLMVEPFALMLLRRPEPALVDLQDRGIEHAVAQSQTFAYHYARRASELGVAFFDASTVARPDPADGVHLDAANTKAIGVGLAPLVKSLLGL